LAAFHYRPRLVALRQVFIQVFPLGGRRGFTEDPQLKQLGVKQPSPENPNTGYGAIWNRGHLGPNQVFSFDKSKEGAWAQCYYADNIAPQVRPPSLPIIIACLIFGSSRIFNLIKSDGASWKQMSSTMPKKPSATST